MEATADRIGELLEAGEQAGCIELSELDEHRNDQLAVIGADGRPA